MKCVSIFALFISLSLGTAFGQEMNQVKSAKDAKTLEAGIHSGSFSILFNKGIDAEKVAKNAAYYTKYFTVKYRPENGEATITFVDKSADSKRIVERFLTSNLIKEVIVGDETLTVDAFTKRFLLS